MGAMNAYGVGVTLPHNRKQESEADYIGLQLMAKAGYDPREAISFWERMSGCPRQMIGSFVSGQMRPSQNFFRLTLRMSRGFDKYRPGFRMP